MTRFARNLLSLILCGCFLSSCIDLREELWLNRTGGGMARITIRLPTKAFELQGGELAFNRWLEQRFRQDTNIHGLNTSIRKEARTTCIDIRLHFHSANKLRASLNSTTGDRPASSAIRHIAGTVRLLPDGLGLRAERKMDFQKALPGAGLLAPRLDKHRLTTIVHFPIRPTSHNASRSEDHGMTLIWERPLSKVMQGPDVQVICYQLPKVWIAAAIGLISGAGLIVFWRIRRSRIRRTQNQTN